MQIGIRRLGSFSLRCCFRKKNHCKIQAYDCNNILVNSCPANFQCRFNSLTAGYVCCGSSTMGSSNPNHFSFLPKTSRCLSQSGTCLHQCVGRIRKGMRHQRPRQLSGWLPLSIQLAEEQILLLRSYYWKYEVNSIGLLKFSRFQTSVQMAELSTARQRRYFRSDARWTTPTLVQMGIRVRVERETFFKDSAAPREVFWETERIYGKGEIQTSARATRSSSWTRRRGCLGSALLGPLFLVRTDTGTIFSKTTCEFLKCLDAIAGRLQLRMGSAVRGKSTPSPVCRRFLIPGKRISSEGCPPFEYALIHKGEIVQCDPFNIENKGCPSTFRYSKKKFTLQSSFHSAANSQ